MEFYHFGEGVYDEVVKIVKFRFYKQIKDTGLVFQQIFEATDLVKKSKFYILVCDNQEEVHYIRFRDKKGFLFWLIKLAKKRLDKLVMEERSLLRINDVESYGESRYYNDTEMTALGIHSIKNLLGHLDKYR